MSIKHMITGVDNTTVDIGRVGFVATLLTFLGIEIWMAYKGLVFSASEFGIGVGAIFAAAGAMLKLKEGSEPNAGNPKSD